MRNIIRSSHDQRRRCSVAVPPDSGLSPATLEALRRGSIATAPSHQLTPGYEASPRRLSANFLSAEQPKWKPDLRRKSEGVACVGANRKYSLAPGNPSPYIRRRSVDNRTKPIMLRRPTLHEIKNSKVALILFVIVICCLSVFVISYVIRDWLDWTE